MKQIFETNFATFITLYAGLKHNYSTTILHQLENY